MVDINTDVVDLHIDWRNEKMPLVRIEMKKGKSKEYKKMIFDCGGMLHID